MITSDGAHKLARPALSALCVVCLSVVVVIKGDVTIEVLGAIVAPATAYILVKWTGNKV